MRRKQRRNRFPLIGTICSVAFVLFMAWLYVYIRDIEKFQYLPTLQKYLILCDAFTIPGSCLIGLGLLVWISDFGAFYGVDYVLSYATMLLKPGGKSKHETYAEYIERKKAQGHVTGYGFLFIVGGISMLISLVFMLLFYQII